MANRLTDALDAFTQELSSAELQLLPSTQVPPDAGDVLKVTEEINNKTNKRRSRNLGLKFASFLESVQQFSNVVDIFVQANPQISALVWGGVKGLMLIVCSYADYFDKLSDMYQKLGSVCPRLSKFQKLFPQSQGLQEAVTEFYTTVIHFCTKTVVFLKASSVKQIFKSAWKPFKLEFKEIEAKLLNERDAIDQEIKLASEIEAQAGRQRACAYQNQGVQHRLFEINQWDGLNLRLNLQEQRTKRELLLMSICAYDHVPEFLRLSDKRPEKAAPVDWFFDNLSFRVWFDSDKSNVLWCHGIPGSGKSVLATRILDYLIATRKVDTFVCYFFCTYADRESLDLRVILGSLLKQILIMLDRWPFSLEHSIETIYLTPMAKPTIFALQNLLIEAVNLLPKVYFVIDGIDECSLDVQSTILAFMEKLIGSHNDFKAIVSSRTDVDVSQAIEATELNLNLIEKRPDIEDFITVKLKEKMEEKKIIPLGDGLLKEVTTALVDGAKGMFLWVDLQIYDICRQHNKNDIRKLLRSLPKDLDNTFERILSRIVDEKVASVALKIFKWLFVARRPLTIAELAEAIALEATDKQYLQLRDRLPDDTRKMIHNCGNLVVVSEIDSTVQFAHFTVKQMLDKASSRIHYLYSPKLYIYELETEAVNREVGCSCMTYLKFSDFERQLVRQPGLNSRQAIAKVSPGIGNSENWIKLILNSASSLGWLWMIVAFAMGSAAKQNSEFMSYGPTPETHNSLFDRLKTQYALLEYISKNWVLHCTHLEEGTPPEEIFQNLLFGPGPSFPYLPWAMVEEDIPSNMPHLPAFKWCIENDQSRILGKVVGDIPSSSDRKAYLTYNLEIAGTVSTAIEFICEKRRTDLLNIIEYTADLTSIDNSEINYAVGINFLKAIQDGDIPFAYELCESGLRLTACANRGVSRDHGLDLRECLRNILNEDKNNPFEKLFEVVKLFYTDEIHFKYDMDFILIRKASQMPGHPPDPDGVLRLLKLHYYSDDVLAAILQWSIWLQYHPKWPQLAYGAKFIELTLMADRSPVLRQAIDQYFGEQRLAMGNAAVDHRSVMDHYLSCMKQEDRSHALNLLVSNLRCEADILHNFMWKLPDVEITEALFAAISSKENAGIKVERLVKARAPCDVARHGISALEHAIDVEADPEVFHQLVAGGARCEILDQAIHLPDKFNTWPAFAKMIPACLTLGYRSFTTRSVIHAALMVWTTKGKNSGYFSTRQDAISALDTIVWHAKEFNSLHLVDNADRTPLLYIIDLAALDAFARLRPSDNSWAISYVNILEKFVEVGADINIPDHQGRTCLRALAEYETESKNYYRAGYKEIIGFLLKAGADPHAEDENGNNVMDYATPTFIKVYNSVREAAQLSPPAILNLEKPLPYLPNNIGTPRRGRISHLVNSSRATYVPDMQIPKTQIRMVPLDYS